jgi:hypothetical protein
VAETSAYKRDFNVHTTVAETSKNKKESLMPPPEWLKLKQNK